MNESNTNCPKCNGEMEEGFIVDYGYGITKPSDWVAGEPVKSIWSGTKIKGKKQYKVATYRCARCGFLESYATEANEDSSIFT
ncbi:MAG: PF20097 family protein [Pyrinomonadaceae bacterium]